MGPLTLALVAGAALLLLRREGRVAPVAPGAAPATAPVSESSATFPPVKASAPLASETVRAVLSDLTQATPRPAPRSIGSILPRPTTPAPDPMPRPQNILAHIERGDIR